MNEPESIETIHRDGTVETINRWRPGGARGNLGQLFCDGDQLLFAVRCCYSPERKLRLTHPEDDREWWDFSVVNVHCDSEEPLTFDCDDPGGWGWSWEDVEWFLPVDEIDLPTLPTED